MPRIMRQTRSCKPTIVTELTQSGRKSQHSYKHRVLLSFISMTVNAVTMMSDIRLYDRRLSEFIVEGSLNWQKSSVLAELAICMDMKVPANCFLDYFGVFHNHSA